VLARLLLLLALLAAQPVWAASETARWPANQPTPDFSLADGKGKTWKLAEARGKVVIVNFWASWCEPCRAEMPSLQQLADFYGNDLVVLAVNFKERHAKVAQFAQAAGLSLPMPMDRDGAVAASYGVKIFPSTVVIAKDGKARLRLVGEVDWTSREVAAWLEPLLK
jgi:thiol-disulfide isomerase/thioredoxin